MTASTFFGWTSLYYTSAPTTKSALYNKAVDGNSGAAACMRLQYVNDICSNGSRIVAVGRGSFASATVTINGNSYDNFWYNKGIDGAASLAAPKVYTIAYSDNGGQNWYYYGYHRTDTSTTTGNVFPYEGISVRWNGAYFIATGKDSGGNPLVRYVSGNGSSWIIPTIYTGGFNNKISDSIWTSENRNIFIGEAIGGGNNTTITYSDGTIPMQSVTTVDPTTPLFDSGGNTLAIKRINTFTRS